VRIHSLLGTTHRPRALLTPFSPGASPSASASHLPSSQQFGEFLLKAQLVRPAAAPSFVRWVRRFLDYAAQQQGVPHPRVESEVVRDDLAHLAVRQRVSECCELRIKDVDSDQGLVFVRSGKGDKDRSTLLVEVGREELRAHLRESEAQHQADRQAAASARSR